ncbi:MAG: hypothetical protein JHC98_04475 [Thermoleophilaceae bacterium]|nr:hypothetical protein [Thermoleophilaceae bacterium]
MIDLPTSDLTDCFGLGVAGNFAGHLEQAGESVDFAGVDAPATAPKGIFPWYLPGHAGFLGAFPLSANELVLPPSDAPLNVQIEPEAGVLCAIVYDSHGAPVALRPRALAAFNDCSIRREGADKISEKKNWGGASKGMAARAFEISELDADGATATLRLACFLRRGETTHVYGVDSPLPGYSYYGNTLLDWIVERINKQTGGEDSPLEPVGIYLAAAGSPGRVLIGIGATRYTDFGETNFLEADDESIVVVYDSTINDANSVETAIREHFEDDLKSASVLVQKVRAA